MTSMDEKVETLVSKMKLNRLICPGGEYIHDDSIHDDSDWVNWFGLYKKHPDEITVEHLKLFIDAYYNYGVKEFYSSDEIKKEFRKEGRCVSADSCESGLYNQIYDFYDKGEDVSGIINLFPACLQKDFPMKMRRGKKPRGVIVVENAVEKKPGCRYYIDKKGNICEMKIK